MKQLITPSVKDYFKYINSQTKHLNQASQYLIGDIVNQDSISIPKLFLREFGDANVALLLAQIVYWHGVSTRYVDYKEIHEPRLRYWYNDHFWIVKQYHEWGEELFGSTDKNNINRDYGERIRRYAKKLKEHDLIKTTTAKSLFHKDEAGNPVRALHVRLNWKSYILMVMRSISNVENDVSQTAKTTFLTNGENDVSIYTYTTKDTYNTVQKDSSEPKDGSDSKKRKSTPADRLTLNKICYPHIPLDDPSLRYAAHVKRINAAAKRIILLYKYTSEALERFGFWFALDGPGCYNKRKNAGSRLKPPTPFSVPKHWVDFLNYEEMLPHWYKNIASTFREHYESFAKGEITYLEFCELIFDERRVSSDEIKGTKFARGKNEIGKIRNKHRTEFELED